MCRQEKEGYCTRRQAKAEPEGEAPAQWPTRETAADYTPEVGLSRGSFTIDRNLQAPAHIEKNQSLIMRDSIHPPCASRAIKM
jgi:hypothetical protein